MKPTYTGYHMNFDVLKKLTKPITDAKFAEVVRARAGAGGHETMSLAEVGLKETVARMKNGAKAKKPNRRR